MRFQPDLVWELARKDWKLFFADRQAALLCFAVPIVLASAFGIVFHRPEGAPLPRLPVALVSEEPSPFTRRVADALAANSELDLRTLDLEAARSWLAGQSAGVVVVLPAGFTIGPDRADRPVVRVIATPGSEYQGRWAEGVLTEVVLKQAARDWLGGARGAVLERPFVVQHANTAGEGSLAVHAYSHSFCGMTLQYLLFWGMDSGLLFLRERRRGLWRRVRAAPVGLNTLLAGKVLSTAMIAVLQIVLTLGFGVLVFGVRVEGSLVGCLLMALSAALLSAATGLLVATLGGNEARARSLSIVAILALSLLGGLWLPAAFLPQWVQRLSLALPTTWACRGFEGVTWRGCGFGLAGQCALALLGFSLAFLAVARWRLRCCEARLLLKGET
jgi:ABC-2 type transport system permease protein